MDEEKSSGASAPEIEGAIVPAEELATPAEGAASAGPAPTRRGRAHGIWQEWIKPLAIIGAVMFSFRSAVADWNDVPSGSMKPTILEGDRIFINKVAYDLKVPFTTIRIAQWDDPHWGDVVVLLSPEDGKRLVKRVVGLPGDVLELRGDILLRNGAPAAYTALDADVANQISAEERQYYSYNNESIEGRAHPVMAPRDAQRYFQPRWGPVEVPPEHFFVMGDNRHNSRDSRYFGAVHRSQILGQAVGVALSLDRNDKYKPRWHRFFSKLP